MGGSDKEPWIQCPILKSYQTIELANKYLKAGEIDACFDIKHYTRHVDMIFKRVGLK